MCTAQVCTEQQLLVSTFLTFFVFCLIFCVFCVKTTKFQLDFKVKCLKTWFYDYPKSKILKFLTFTTFQKLQSHLKFLEQSPQLELCNSNFVLQPPRSHQPTPTPTSQLATSNLQLPTYNSILKCTIQKSFWTSNL